jgi:hypothetical protein
MRSSPFALIHCARRSGKFRFAQAAIDAPSSVMLISRGAIESAKRSPISFLRRKRFISVSGMGLSTIKDDQSGARMKDLAH